MDFDATNLYSSAKLDKNSVHPKIETACAFKQYMIDIFDDDFNNKLLIKMVMTHQF